MTYRVCILIDFENVQPTVEELTPLRGGQHRIVIFHGPHQTKFDAAMVKALQPLGERVDYVQCDRKGKNALDFHIAFHLGRLVEGGEREGGSGDVQYVIVSRDGGFEGLLEHVRSHGHRARMAPTLGDAVSMPTPADALSILSHVMAAPAPPASVKPAAKKKVSKSPTTSTKQGPPTLRQRLIENLRAHPKNRPSSRAALERHIATLAGNEKPPARSIAELIDGLTSEGVLTVGDKAIAYALPGKAKAP